MASRAENYFYRFTYIWSGILKYVPRIIVIPLLKTLFYIDFKWNKIENFIKQT